MREKSPFVCAAIALNAMTLPRADTILPFPAETMLDSLTSACLRLRTAARNVILPAQCKRSVHDQQRMVYIECASAIW